MYKQYKQTEKNKNNLIYSYYEKQISEYYKYLLINNRNQLFRLFRKHFMKEYNGLYNFKDACYIDNFNSFFNALKFKVYIPYAKIPSDFSHYRNQINITNNKPKAKKIKFESNLVGTISDLNSGVVENEVELLGILSDLNNGVIKNEVEMKIPQKIKNKYNLEELCEILFVAVILHEISITQGKKNKLFKNLGNNKKVIKDNFLSLNPLAYDIVKKSFAQLEILLKKDQQPISFKKTFEENKALFYEIDILVINSIRLVSECRNFSFSLLHPFINDFFIHMEISLDDIKNYAEEQTDLIETYFNNYFTTTKVSDDFLDDYSTKNSVKESNLKNKQSKITKGNHFMSFIEDLNRIYKNEKPDYA